MHRAVRTALASRVSSVVLVTGHRGAAVAAAVADLAGELLTVVCNEDWRDGQSTSVGAGLAAVTCRGATPTPEATPGAAVFVPCDQPLLTREVIDTLVQRWEEGRPAAVVPVAGEGIHRRRGAPVLFDSRCFEALARLGGDTGGRALLAELGDAVAEVEIDDPRALVDVDTPAALLELATGRRT